jgi:4-hydroxybenzoate polyprenyltransferase
MGTRAWLQLLRAPNLFTVPGDPLAGFLLAYGSMNDGKAFVDQRAVFAVMASLCAYGAGLIMNDIFDLEEDRRDRPDRPLARGAISVRMAWIVCCVLCAASAVAMNVVAGQAGVVAAMLLLAAVGLYNGASKKIPIVGALNMGLCRGLSMWLGAVAFVPQIWPMSPLVLIGSALIALYIAAVTNLARHETEKSAPPLAKSLPALPVLAAVVLSTQYLGAILQSYATTVFALALMVVAAELGRLFRRDAPPLPPAIGTLIRVLLPLQAALCLVYPWSLNARICAVALLAMTPVSHAVSRRFYAS